MNCQGANASFLKIPQDRLDYEKCWEELTLKGKLWNELSKLVRLRAKDETFRELHAHLEDWKKYAELLPAGNRQWKVAGKLLELAEKAANQPPMHDERVERACFPNLLPWEWDAFCALRGTPRSPLSNTCRRLSVLFEQLGREGSLAVLEMELVANGRCEIYADPKSNAFIVFDQTFQDAYKQAWEWAQADAKPGEQGKLRQVDARFRLKPVDIPYYFDPNLSNVGGNSAQAAFYLCLLHASKAYLECADTLLLDPSVAVTATLSRANDKCHLGGVGGLNAKMEAAYLKGLRTVIVANAIEMKAKSELENAKLRYKESHDYSALTKVFGCEDPAIAAEEASGLLHEVMEYLTGLVCALDTTPWYRGGQRIRTSAVAIPARVLKEEVAVVRVLNPRTSRTSAADQEREPAYRHVDPELAALYEEPTLLKRKTVVPWQQEREQIQRAVILGAPGGGKSFLANITAIDLAQHTLAQLWEQQAPLDSLSIPIHLELPALAQQKQPYFADAVLALLQQKYRLPERLVEWLRAKLTTDRCWLILDALDQVPEADLPRLRQRLEAMETQRWQCRVVLTCRTANYDRSWIPWHKVTEYDLASFDPGEIRQFIAQWFEQGNARGKTLCRVIDRNFPLAHACRSPLIVTLTCLAHEEQAVTEQTLRAELYARILRGLVRRAWKENPQNPNNPHIDDMLRLLEHIGWTLFNLRPEANLFTNSQIVNALQSAPNAPLPLKLQQQIDGGGLHPTALAYAPSLLRDELRDTGILVGAGLSQSGETQFSFLHRTFLEFLAASALARWAEPSPVPLFLWGTISSLPIPRCRGDAEKVWKEIAPHLHDNHWREVIRLLIEKLSSEDDDEIGEELIQKILNAETPYEDLLQRNLFLAASCLVAGVTAEIQTYQTIFDQTIDRALYSPYFVQREYAIEILKDLANSRYKNDVMDRFASLLSDNDSHVSGSAAYVLGRMGQTDGRIIEKLVGLLSDEDADMRRSATEALGSIGQTDERIIKNIVFLLSDKDAAVRASATEALGNIGQIDDSVIENIVLLLSDEDAAVRARAAEVLGSTGQTDERIIEKLIELLSDEESSVRRSAADVLGSIGQTDDSVIEKLVSLLSDEDADMRRSAAEALSMTGRTDEHLIDKLVGCLSDKELVVRRRAAYVLGNIGQADKRVVEALVERLSDEDAGVRSRAASALVTIGQTNDSVIEKLVLLLSDEDAEVRWSATEAIGRIGQIDERIIEKLFRLFSDKDAYVRKSVVYVLGSIGQTDKRVIEPLVRRLSDKKAEMRGRAAEVLGRTGQTDKRVVESLVRRLSDKDAEVRGKAAEALGRIGQIDERIIEKLFQLLSDEDAKVRGRATYGLVKIGRLNERVLDSLKSICDNPNKRFDDSLEPEGKRDYIAISDWAFQVLWRHAPSRIEKIGLA